MNDHQKRGLSKIKCEPLSKFEIVRDSNLTPFQKESQTAENTQKTWIDNRGGEKGNVGLTNKLELLRLDFQEPSFAHFSSRLQIYLYDGSGISLHLCLRFVASSSQIECVEPEDRYNDGISERKGSILEERRSLSPSLSFPYSQSHSHNDSCSLIVLQQFS